MIWILTAALAACAADDEPTLAHDVGVLDLDLSRPDVVSGHYRRRLATYPVVIDVAGTDRHVALRAREGVLIAYRVELDAGGDIAAAGLDWPAMSPRGELELVDDRPIFADLGDAAEVWAAGAPDAPAWIVPVLSRASRLVPLRSPLDPEEPPPGASRP